MHPIRSVGIEQVRLNPHNARTHSRQQIGQIASSIREFGFVVPVVVDDTGTVIAGHGRVEAAKHLGLATIPIIVLRGFSPSRKRALALADNKIAENAGWDRERLAIELSELSELLIEDGLDISITGFEPVEIDQLHADFAEQGQEPEDDVNSSLTQGPTVTRVGDLWCLGEHRLLCGDARSERDVAKLMDGRRGAMGFLDPPYNVPGRNIGGRGRTKHDDFVMARGEMSSSEFTQFLTSTLGLSATASCDGAVHFVCMDWRHVGELIEAGGEAYGAMLNLVVWDKTNAGQGSLYRSQHELIGVFRVGSGKHQNNVQLGKYGRNRSNVWRYAGANTFRAGRMEDLRAHPTVKPLGLVRDAIQDTTRRGDVVIDTFSGAGTTILAAERVGRRAYALEIEPRYVDVAVRRWQTFTRKDAIHAETGAIFDEVAVERPIASAGRGAARPRRRST